MAGGDLNRLLRWYPPAWRDRYGEELVVYMEDHFGPGRPPLVARLSLLAGGIRERVRRCALAGDGVPSPDRVRAGVLTVLSSWTAFVVAGSSFAKLSEHFDAALPSGAGPRDVPDLAYTVVQSVAMLTGLVVIVGALLAVPSFVRFLRSSGWPSIRSHVIRAAACTLLTAGLSIPLLVWAHHLNDHQRNGGLPGFGALFLAWAAVVVLALTLWTAVAVAAGRRVTLSRPFLVVEAVLAVAVAGAMLVILTATALWWAAIAGHAPSFLSADPSSPLNAQLVATVALMTVAVAAAVAGVISIVRGWPVLCDG
jgi:hypothetical protein